MSGPRIARTHVDWWDGYDTLIVGNPPKTPTASQVRSVNRWIEQNKPTLYVPIPFQEFLHWPPWRHRPHERWKVCAEQVSFEGKTVVDVGCSVGYYGFLAAAAGAENVLAFETYDKARDLLVDIAELYGFDNIKAYARPFGPLAAQRDVDITLAFSVLPYLAKPDPKRLKRTLKALAQHSRVSFIEMGDGGSGLDWCQGDEAFRELFEEAGFSRVLALASVFSSHTNTQRTLWRCDGK